MSRLSFLLENFSQKYPSAHLSLENHGLSNDQVWPLVWTNQDGEFHHYIIKPGWKLLGTCKPPFYSNCENNNRAFIAENLETHEIYWWHFCSHTMVIHKNILSTLETFC